VADRKCRAREVSELKTGNNLNSQSSNGGKIKNFLKEPQQRIALVAGVCY